MRIIIFTSLVFLAAALTADEWLILPGFSTERAAQNRSRSIMTNLQSRAMRDDPQSTQYWFGWDRDPILTNTWCLRIAPVNAPARTNLLSASEKISLKTRSWTNV